MPCWTNSLFSEFFKKLEGVILRVCEATWRLSGGHFEGVWGEIRWENYSKIKNGKTLVYYYLPI